MKASRRGFTLVEILVVITVMCILMAIVLPVARKVRETARRTRCTHNLQAIHACIFVYAGDYRERFPYASVLNIPPSHWRQLHRTLAAYVQDAVGSTKGEQLLFLDGHVEYISEQNWWGYGGGIW